MATYANGSRQSFSYNSFQLTGSHSFEIRKEENKKQKFTPTFPISKRLSVINMKTYLNSQEGFGAWLS